MKAGWVKLAMGLTVPMLFGVGIGLLWSTQTNQADSDDCRYGMINPLRCSQSSVDKEGGYGNFEKELSNYVDQKRQSGDAMRIGIHFRNLRNAGTAGVNEDDLFIPASLFKLPIAMSYYRLSESLPQLLSKTITTPANFTSPTQITPAVTEEIKPNQTYTVYDLLRRMLVYSDNRALEVVTKIFPGAKENITQNAIEDMGVLYESRGGEIVISPRQYSGILRILYNANFLNEASSETILGWLAEADFNDGLKRYLPAGMRVAHKYGIARTGDNGEVNLSDCGIIYHKGAPYALCVMTASKNYEAGAQVIAEISKMIYEEIDRRY